jgi:hypothetical protein
MKLYGINLYLYILFVCSLLNGAISRSDYIASNHWIIVNNELGNMRKEFVMT